jgi:hypothetical protein
MRLCEVARLLTAGGGQGLFRLKFGRQFGISTETQASSFFSMSELLGMRKA